MIESPPVSKLHARRCFLDPSAGRWYSVIHRHQCKKTGAPGDYLAVLLEVSASPEQIAAISFDVCIEDLDRVAFGFGPFFRVSVRSDDLYDHRVLIGEFELQLRQSSFNDSLEDVNDICLEQGEHVESLGIAQSRVHLNNCRSLVFREHHLSANHAAV